MKNIKSFKQFESVHPQYGLDERLDRLEDLVQMLYDEDREDVSFQDNLDMEGRISNLEKLVSDLYDEEGEDVSIDSSLDNYERVYNLESLVDVLFSEEAEDIDDADDYRDHHNIK